MYKHSPIFDFAVNKRAKTASSRPLEFKSSKPKSSAAELFVTLRPPFEQI